MATVSGTRTYTVLSESGVSGSTPYTVLSSASASVGGTTPYTVVTAPLFYLRVGATLQPVQLAKRNGSNLDLLTP